MSPETIPPVKKALPRKASTSQNLSSLALYILELLLPPLLAVGLAAWLFSYYNLWSMGRLLSTILFVLAAVLVAFMLVVVLDMLTARMRTVRGVAGGGPLARLLKFALGGLVLPIALALTVNLVTLPAGGTLLERIASLVTMPVKVTPPDEVAQTVLAASDPAVKRSGIEVLARFQSDEALTQLLRLANEDSAALRDAATARALSEAIAAYGADTRTALFDLFNSVEPTADGGGLSDDLYGRYFSSGFDGLEAEVSGLAPAQKAQVEAARAQLQAALEGLHLDSIAGMSGDPRPLFALQTFQAMGLASEPEILAFARKIPPDPRFNAAVRGEALLLIGKLGKQADLPLLYEQLDSADPYIQTRALQAISAILAKGEK